MPRRYVAAANAIQNQMAANADRASAAGTPTIGDDADLMHCVSTTERTALLTSFAKGTSHTGSVTGRRAAGFVVSFGKFSGILPYNCTSGAKLKVGDRVKITVVEFDGQRPPKLTR